MGFLVTVCLMITAAINLATASREKDFKYFDLMSLVKIVVGSLYNCLNPYVLLIFSTPFRDEFLQFYHLRNVDVVVRLKYSSKQSATAAKHRNTTKS